MHKNIDEEEIIIFDTETTGLDPDTGDRIVEIAAVRLKNQQRLAVFQSLVNPCRQISEAAFKVNHITEGMLVDAPDMAKVLPDFLNFIEGAVLCSYNAAFDMRFLENEARLTNNNIPSDIIVIDVLKMAKRLLPGIERYALWFVANALGVTLKQEHRALADVEMTINVFNKLIAILRNKGIVDFVNFTGLFSLGSKASQDILNQKTARIQEAINLGVKLNIRYISASSASVSERQVIPKEIRQENNHLYMLGHCCLRNEERLFRIDGILYLEIV